ncbi:hypothetical protein [Magnetospira sp. QH-2]|nr:hypothetical protein [Magnetospira sp. QH-2]
MSWLWPPDWNVFQEVVGQRHGGLPFRILWFDNGEQVRQFTVPIHGYDT